MTTCNITVVILYWLRRMEDCVCGGYLHNTYSISDLVSNMCVSSYSVQPHTREEIFLAIISKALSILVYKYSISTRQPLKIT